MVNAIKSIQGLLKDSQKHKIEILSTAKTIKEKAEEIESKAMAEIKKNFKLLQTASGPARTIAEASYLRALDDKRKAQDAIRLSQKTIESMS